MGFLSFHFQYYERSLAELEAEHPTEERIYRAKQLLKMLDDLLDEGYTELNDRLEASIKGVTRLRSYLADHQASPFTVPVRAYCSDTVHYDPEEYPLPSAIHALLLASKSTSECSRDPFIAELIRFCEWIGYEEDTAYLFLLRDTLLPYIYYQSNNRSSIHPWLLGRKTLEMLTGQKNTDDLFRGCIIDALEKNQCSNYGSFCAAVLPAMKAILDRYPETAHMLTDLLQQIKEPRIIVVESGCSGTFPLLLKSLDDRIDIRMYTTYPYLLNIYGSRIFTPKYEEIRLFETLCSQDLYFRFSGFQNGCFYVTKCSDPDIEERALAEIRSILT